MKKERIFRHLVTNKQYKNPQCHKILFAFQTVFHFTYYSYRCCPCAFQHEFLDYIEDDGTINEEVYEKIAQSISTGKCPHVTDDVPEELLKETVVSGAHVALANGGDKLKLVIDDTVNSIGIFKLQLYALALIKYKYFSARYYYEHYLETKAHRADSFVLYCTKSDNNSETFIINKVSDLEAFVHAKNEKLLENILKLRSRFLSSSLYFSHRKTAQKAIHHTIKYGLQSNILNMLLIYNKQLQPESLEKCILYAIMCNNLKALEKLLRYMYINSIYKNPTDAECAVKRRCDPVFQGFERPNCKAFLSKYGLFQETDINAHPEYMRILLLQIMEFDDFRPECFAALQKLPDTGHHGKGYKCPYSVWNYNWLRETDWHLHPQDVREILKLHIHGNFDLELQKSDGSSGIGIDHEGQNFL